MAEVEVLGDADDVELVGAELFELEVLDVLTFGADEPHATNPPIKRADALPAMYF